MKLLEILKVNNIKINKNNRGVKEEDNLEWLDYKETKDLNDKRNY